MHSTPSNLSCHAPVVKFAFAKLVLAKQMPVPATGTLPALAQLHVPSFAVTNSPCYESDRYLTLCCRSSLVLERQSAKHFDDVASRQGSQRRSGR